MRDEPEFAKDSLAVKRDKGMYVRTDDVDACRNNGLRNGAIQ